MSEDGGFFEDVGDMWDSGVSAVDHLADAAVDVGAGVIDTFQTGAQTVLAGVDYALGDEAGGDQHWDAAEQNADEAIGNYGEAYEEMF